MKELQEYCIEFIVPQRDKPKEFGGSIPWCRIEDIQGKYLNGTMSGQYVTDETIKKMNLKVIPKGAVICSCSASLGVQAILTTPCVTNQTFIGIVPKEELDSEFLYYMLKSKTAYFKKIGTGTTIPYISRKKFEQLLVPELSLAEQSQVVEVLRRAECVIDARKKELKQLDDLIKARFVELFGDVQHEEKYKGIQLRELCTTMSGGTPSTKFPEYYEGDIPWISTVSLGPNHIDGSTAKGYITQEAIDNSATKLIPAGNILFGTRVGVGKSSLNDVNICTNQDIVAIIGIDEKRFKRLFIKHVLDAYQPYYDSIKKGATILGITGDDLKDTLIPDAPIEVQMEYEAFVEQVDKSKFAVQKELEETQLLFDSLMQKYFG